MYKKLKRCIVPMLLSIMFCTSAFTVFAAEETTTTSGNTTVTVNNNIQTGAVSISLEGGGTVTNEITPGGTVDFTTNVKNNAEDCWLRAKVKFISDDDITGLDDSKIAYGDNWKKIGEYYYYTSIVPINTSVAFTKTITFPTEWTAADQHIDTQIQVDAVQSKNFTPDFNTSDPWFGTVIEESLITNYERKSSVNNNINIEFKGGAEGLVKPSSDFLDDWKAVMPGDTLTGSLDIANNSENDVKISFSATNDGDKELLGQLDITIKNGDTSIYSGKMTTGVEETLLGQYKKGDKTTFTYEVKVPETLNNSYAVKDAVSTWVFKAEEIIPESEKEKTPEKEKKVTPTPTKTPSETTTTTTKTPVTVQTLIENGQFTIPAIIFLSVSLILGVVAIIRKKKGGVRNEK